MRQGREDVSALQNELKSVEKGLEGSRILSEPSICSVQGFLTKADRLYVSELSDMAAAPRTLVPQ
jgi:hypothetical protein